jgi:hypothetical protein
MLLWSFFLRRSCARRLHRKTRAALTRLDADARADIGLCWREIDRVAQESACRAVVSQG